MVVNLHAAWTLQYGVAATRRRLRSTDGVLEVSDFVAAGFRRAFPDYGGLVGTV